MDVFHSLLPCAAPVSGRISYRIKQRKNRSLYKKNVCYHQHKRSMLSPLLFLIIVSAHCYNHLFVYFGYSPEHCLIQFNVHNSPNTIWQSQMKLNQPEFIYFCNISQVQPGCMHSYLNFIHKMVNDLILDPAVTSSSAILLSYEPNIRIKVDFFHLQKKPIPFIRYNYSSGRFVGIQLHISKRFNQK